MVFVFSQCRNIQFEGGDVYIKCGQKAASRFGEIPFVFDIGYI